MKSAYNGLLEVMDGTARGTQRQSIYTGVVRSVSPLTVETAGVLLTAEDLLVNEQLLAQSYGVSMTAAKGTQKGKCSGCTSGGGSEVSFTTTDGSGTAVISRAGTLTVGCRVALASADLNTFILLCKVVKL